MKCKTAIITGATGGIGTEICKYLLRNGYLVLASCRHAEKGEKLRKELAKTISIQQLENLLLFDLDLLSFRSVDNFANQVSLFLKRYNAGIDLLVNNAGIIAPKFHLTKDGFESSFQVNYLSPQRLIQHLLPLINWHGKIINTVSCTINVAKVEMPNHKSLQQQEKEFVSLKNYSNTKLYLSLYTIQLQKELNDIFVCGADPGIVDTGIITQHRWYDLLADFLFRPFIKHPAQGAIPIIRAIEYPVPTLPSNTPALLFRGKNGTNFKEKILQTASTFNKL